VGWLTALLGLFVAVAALPAGFAIGRVGAVRATVYGSLLLVAGGLALSLVMWPGAIFGARLVEALGYLVVCISLPAILNDISPARWKGPVLAIWSGFVPLGYATADLLAAFLVPLAGVQIFLLVSILAYAACWQGAWATLLRLGANVSAPVPGRIGATLSPAVLLVAATFGVFVVLSVAFFTFLPTFAGAAALLLPAGLIALTVPIGNVLASVLVRGKGTGFMASLAIAGFAVCVLAALLTFAGGSPAMATAMAVLLAVASAVVASALFAAIPFVTPASGSVPAAIGIVSQAGGIGTLVGPPLGAAFIESLGWTGFGWFLAATALGGIACLAPLALTAKRQPA
jgi:MFS family permease